MAKVMFGNIHEQRNDSVYGCWNIFATLGSSGFVQVSR
jgi:hypothetical protein